MFQRQKNWISDVLWKPKKPHSLEQLRYLHYVLTKNQMVNETNRGLLVETLRSIAEILIWGDQNDSRVFDFFLEKNMLQFFQKFMNQTAGRFICVQLLQTLSILFENIRNETSLYYLLSNNHVNSIIIHKFDFSDEEILAYYISFIKTLSLKLNRHTIHFFFNERKNDFPLYTEAIKFFNHNDRMVKIAVRTLTLNVYRVGDKAMLSFIRDKTADPYFSNLAWFIGNHAIELNSCVLRDSDHLRCDRLKDLVAEHLDHLHYLNDIFTLNIEDLNSILTEQLSNRLLIPLYIYSLVSEKPNGEKKEQIHISTLVSLFLLSQILLILSHPPLMSTLIDIILNGDEMLSEGTPEDSPQLLRNAGSKSSSVNSIRTFQPPEDTLEESLVASGVNTEAYSFLGRISLTRDRKSVHIANSKFYVKGVKKRENRLGRTEFDDSEGKQEIEEKLSPRTAKLNGVAVPLTDTPLGGSQDSDEDQLTHPAENAPLLSHDDSYPQPWKVPVAKFETEKEHLQKTPEAKSLVKRSLDFECNRMFFSAIQLTLDCSENDEEALFALSLIYATITNTGVDQKLLKMAGISSQKTQEIYNEELVQNIIRLMEQGCRNGSKVRTVTLQMAIAVLKELVLCDGGKTSYMCDHHLAFVESVREASTLQLRHYYKDEEIFLDMFEDEYRQMKMKPLNVQRLMTDATLLLPITGTPLTGIEFSKRLPCGEVEHARRAIRVFLMMRELCLTLMNQPETRLPLSKVEHSVHQEDVLDLNNSDLIACTVKIEDKSPLRRFLVIDEAQFILVEPDTSRLGWGVVKFVARLQDVETSPDREDSRSLFITIHQPFSANCLTKVRARPIMSAKFVFDDYIRCMSAKQRLQRRRLMLKQHKLHCIAQLLELPALATPPSHYYSITPPAYINLGQQQQQSYVGPSPTSSHVAPSQEIPSQGESRPFLEEQNKLRARRGDQTSSRNHIQGQLGPAMAAPEQCLSPSRSTTSQAEALASVLRQSPPPGEESSEEVLAKSRVERAVSVEEAVEALEIEMQQIENERSHLIESNCVKRDLNMLDRVAKDCVTDLARNERAEDSSTPGTCSASSSRPETRSQSLENLVNCSADVKKFISLSAPASPRGTKHPPPVDPIEYENVARLAAVNSMSEPTLFLNDSFQESVLRTSPSNKTNTRPKRSRRQKGKDRKH